MEAIRRQSGDLKRAGSALLLTVVLTVLLALIGVLFVMAARLDEMGTSSIADERELSSAVDSVVSQTAKVLVDDLFGTMRTSKLVDGTADNERFDSPVSDRWLASLEPEWVGAGIDPNDRSDDNYQWRRISDLYNLMAAVLPLSAQIVDPDGPGLADADGDGVSDSWWVMVPNLRAGKGRNIYAAIRIIDNCAMLNLNTAYGIDKDSDGRYLSSVDYTKFLRGDDINFPERILRARDPQGLAAGQQLYHNEVVMKLENPNAGLAGPAYQLFDMGDELEIRNRYLLTSLAQAHFERGGVVGLDVDVAYETFDYGRGMFTGGWNTAIRSRRRPFTGADFDAWKWRIDPFYFAVNVLPDTEWYKYDRRHVCTFYSFDRNLRTGRYPVLEAALENYEKNVRDIFIPKGAATTNIESPLEVKPYNNSETRKKILQVLYALRAYILVSEEGEGITVEQAARRSAQFMANMIDYIDNQDPTAEGPFYDARFGDGAVGQRNEDVTYINRAIIRELILEASLNALGAGNEIDIDVATNLDFGLGTDETVYGYECQPFISELYTNWDGDTLVPEDNGCQVFAIELINPYHNPNGLINLEGWRIKIGDEEYDLDNNFEVPEASSGEPGRLVIWSSISGSAPTGGDIEIEDFGLRLVLSDADVVELQRPDPANEDEYITVDKTGQDQLVPLREDGIHASKRDDTGWKFADMSEFIDDGSGTLGAANGVSLGSANYQMPVADNQEPIATLGDFERVIFFSSEPEVASDPNSAAKTVTEYMASAAVEGDVRFDVEQRRELLDYICFLNRNKGTLPGRININTATEEVIRAAIPPEAELWDANDLSADIVTYRDTAGSFTDIMDLLNVPGFDSLASDPNEQIGNLLVRGDIEERDWILSRVSNIFTVRSDVFTAYILVRLGSEGPQRRVIAIFDRSNVDSPLDRPRVIAVHPVPAVR